MKRILLLGALLLLLLAQACGVSTSLAPTSHPSLTYTFDGGVPAGYTPPPVTIDPSKITIVTTYSIFASIVKDLVGAQANVVSLIPNGQDIQAWQPTSDNIAILNKADLVVENGLGLETGLLPALNAARSKGIRFFTASDYVDYHAPNAKEWPPYIPVDQSQKVVFPYIWMDYYAMLNNVRALHDVLLADFNLNTDQTMGNEVLSMGFLDHDVTYVLRDAISPQNRVIITDQAPLLFCDYISPDYKVIVLNLPGLRDSSQISKSNLDAIKKAFHANPSPAIFLRPGVPQAVSDAITKATGAIVVQFDTYAETDQIYQGQIVDRGYPIGDIFMLGLGNALGQ